MMTPDVDERSTTTSGREHAVLLEVKHLKVDYETGSDPVRAVTDVSFTLNRGQILGLAGESGSGKSTLAYAITRLLHAPANVSSEEIWYYPKNDRPFVTEMVERQSIHVPWVKRKTISLANERAAINLLALSTTQLRAFRWQEMAIVFQSAMNALNPVMRLETQITDVLQAHNPSMSADACHLRTLELLRLVGISPDRLRSYPHELSGGMRQRAIIAIALALNPEIIIMDEPTTALDVVLQRDILVELMALREHLSFAVIFITHDLSLLLEIADHVRGTHCRDRLMPGTLSPSAPSLYLRAAELVSFAAWATQKDDRHCRLTTRPAQCPFGLRVSPALPLRIQCMLRAVTSPGSAASSRSTHWCARS